ncbi:DUF4268 domain-containing protein [Pedobacter cryotolerans]|uniref:DUF4268 domain-containing protein n=1 Tax=Pedobacter cryotolerans TaxID=2571270 RepID=A0A4U1C2G3_9SPHI|nr:DUF4268 domain-containing protein [Pedobacter cryotolerans]TKB99402.1 DUF4268 domain-containing protein [Pedobacter cryotolerans]
MYSKEEASKLRQQFWITFGKYMKPILSAEGLPINWVNYKTGVKNVFFKMNAEQKYATISIAITHADFATRTLFFEQFIAFKNLFNDAINEQWEWEPNAVDEYGVTLSKISKTITHVTAFNQQDWPKIISFLKPRIIALDQFWTDVKPVFEDLG